MRLFTTRSAVIAAACALPGLGCQEGTGQACLAPSLITDGRCLEPCPVSQERYNGECVPRCDPREERVQGVCTAPPQVRVNTVGYLAASEKGVVVSGLPATEHFEVLDAESGAVVFEGPLSGPFTDGDTQEQLWRGEFSAFETPGQYVVHVQGAGSSAPFAIERSVYAPALHAALLGFYGLRCGQAVAFVYAGDRFAHGACHQADAFASLSSGDQVLATGGWHDAGDYGKYVVNAGFTVGLLLSAWEHFQPTLTALKLPELHDAQRDGVVPDSAAPNGPISGSAAPDSTFPDVLLEVKHGLDWMLTMQTANGSVHHKLTAANFEGFIMPENDGARRALAPISAEATASFAAAMARAARAFAPYDAEYSATCLNAARRAQTWLEANAMPPAVDLTGFSTGEYKTSANDDRFWALVELWATTGEEPYLRQAEAQVPEYLARDSPVRTAWDWSDVENLGLFTYALHSTASSADADPELLADVRAAIVQSADALVARASAENNLYRRAVSAYYWGSNGIVARSVMNLFVASTLAPNNAYRRTALHQVSHLLGVNVFGRSLVTGVGHMPPLRPHHRPSGADDVQKPWPGLLVGGPNGQAIDANRHYDLSIPAAAWQDVQESYWSNEVAINWNGAWVYALAWANTP